MTKIVERAKNAWNVFMGLDRPSNLFEPSSYTRPDRVRYNCWNERSIILSICNRISIDAYVAYKSNRDNY